MFCVTNSSISVRNALFVSAIIAFSLLAVGPVQAELSVDEARAVIKHSLYTSVANHLADSLKSPPSKTALAGHNVRTIAETALRDSAHILKGQAQWNKKAYLGLVTRIEREFERIFQQIDEPLEKGNFTDEEAVAAYLQRLMKRFSGAVATNPLSHYRLVVGGSFVHEAITADSALTDSADVQNLAGEWLATLLVRTRLWDRRKNIFGAGVSQENPFEDEKGFLDLLVEAVFLTNEPFTRIPGDNAADSVASIFLSSVKSSKLKMGLFWSPGWAKMDDLGRAGLFARFNISTQEGNADVFRRLDLGARLENRSNSALHLAAAEVGFTTNNVAGSRQSEKIWDFERVVLNMELPLRMQETLGFFVGFHGEWRIRNKDQLTVENADGFEVSVDKNPPIYEFRIGVIVDPTKLLAGIFGTIGDK